MIERASCQGCGELTVFTDAESCPYCGGLLLKVQYHHVGRPGRSDNNITRWTDLRREQVVNAYAQGHGIPEIADVIWQAMGYKNVATARGAIRQEFRRMKVRIRPRRLCTFEGGCQRNAATGSDLCFAHDPDCADRRKAHLDQVRVQYLAGEQHPLAKLTDEEAREIRASDEVAELLSVRYGISEGHVRVIQRGEGWAHLEAVA